ncbi:unnamed protein product [Phyllotreta striolata]|uniref:Receptor ligand binding region domain-containing protein n=1 Tax=Phyllotreta striolata TaxID=444603 RepID=A0A9N9XNT8_PHYSR|nr:unnamed protein product [Phyllotreta striolata]
MLPDHVPLIITLVIACVITTSSTNHPDEANVTDLPDANATDCIGNSSAIYDFKCGTTSVIYDAETDYNVNVNITEWNMAGESNGTLPKDIALSSASKDPPFPLTIKTNSTALSPFISIQDLPSLHLISRNGPKPVQHPHPGHHPAWPVKREAIVEGDLVLGGLMMVHEREETVTCGPIMPQGGIQALEAMLYTIDRVNANGLLNVTLGAHVLDDCDKDTYGLEMAVDFIKALFTVASLK